MFEKKRKKNTKSQNWFPQEGVRLWVVPHAIAWPMMSFCKLLTCFDRIPYSLQANWKGRERERVVHSFLLYEIPQSSGYNDNPPASCYNHAFTFPRILALFLLSSSPGQTCVCVFTDHLPKLKEWKIPFHHHHHLHLTNYAYTTGYGPLHITQIDKAKQLE